MGFDWLKQRNLVPNPGDLSNTHVFLKLIEAHNLEDLYVRTRSDDWTLTGETRVPSGRSGRVSALRAVSLRPLRTEMALHRTYASVAGRGDYSAV